MRTDLDSMKAGRAAAQASHATSAFMHDFGPNSKCPRSEVKEWMQCTKQGFGTCIVLGVTGKQIDTLFYTEPLKSWIMKGEVYDPDYVILVSPELAHLLDHDDGHRPSNYTLENRPDGLIAVHRHERTCAYVFGDACDEDLESIRQLPLYA